MSNKIWKEMWLHDEIPFHQNASNPLLKQFIPQLQLAAGANVLVPLCGKSLDLAFLTDCGFQVTGIELSAVAIKAYFEQ